MDQIRNGYIRMTAHAGREVEAKSERRIVDIMDKDVEYRAAEQKEKRTEKKRLQRKFKDVVKEDMDR